jgi:hypothetical protein
MPAMQSATAIGTIIQENNNKIEGFVIEILC